MEHAKKMILVPADTVEHQQNQQHTDSRKEPMTGSGSGEHTAQTPGDTVSRLDAELSNILKSNKFHDDTDKWKQFLQVLQRYLFHVGPKSSSPEVSQPSTEHAAVASASEQNRCMDVDTIIGTVPENYKQRASSLVNYLRSSSEIAKRIEWDSEGRVSIDGVVSPNCNIVDLVNDAVRFRRTFKANERDRFMRILRDSGVPSKLIGNKTLWELTKPLSVKHARLGMRGGDRKRRRVNPPEPSENWISISRRK